MHCPECGAKLPDKGTFCPACGTQKPEAVLRQQRASTPVQQRTAGPPPQAMPAQLPPGPRQAGVAPMAHGATGMLPGPLKGSNPFLVGALLMSLVAAFVVMTGDIGWVYSREVFYPYHYPDDVAQYSYHDYSYGFSDGGMYAAGIGAITLFLLLATLMAILAIIRARTPQARYFLLGGIAVSVIALIATIGAMAAFNSWAADEDFDDWGASEAAWGGLVGSILLIVLFAVPTFRASSGTRPVPPPPGLHGPGAMPYPGPPRAGYPPAHRAPPHPPVQTLPVQSPLGRPHSPAPGQQAAGRPPPPPYQGPPRQGPNPFPPSTGPSPPTGHHPSSDEHRQGR